MKIVLEEEVPIAPEGVEAGSNNMVRHPNGSIWLNTKKTETGLFRSGDDGKTWESIPMRFSVQPDQSVSGFYIGRDGRLWAAHQGRVTEGGTLASSPEIYISHSDDEGQTWTSASVDFASLSPGAPGDPYVSASVTGGHPNFLERPDGTVMFSCSMRYADWEEYGQADQSRPGIRDVMVRTRDGGRSWGNPTIVHQHATETAYAVDPADPDHIVAATRIQRKPLPGEDGEAIKLVSAVTYPRPDDWCYKNGLLLDSRDGGRTFTERDGNLYGFGSYRWSMVWTPKNVLALVSFAGLETGDEDSDSRHVVRISMDGGETWIDDSADGTQAPNRATRFTLVPARSAADYSDRLAATVHIGGNRFLTTFRYKKEQILKALYWRFE